jgi:hypothetical protein
VSRPSHKSTIDRQFVECCHQTEVAGREVFYVSPRKPKIWNFVIFKCYMFTSIVSMRSPAFRLVVFDFLPVRFCLTESSLANYKKRKIRIQDFKLLPCSLARQSC